MRMPDGIDVMLIASTRLVSAALVPITIVPFAAGSVSPLLDSALIGLTIVHSYIGFQ